MFRTFLIQVKLWEWLFPSKNVCVHSRSSSYGTTTVTSLQCQLWTWRLSATNPWPKLDFFNYEKLHHTTDIMFQFLASRNKSNAWKQFRKQTLFLKMGIFHFLIMFNESQDSLSRFIIQPARVHKIFPPHFLFFFDVYYFCFRRELLPSVGRHLDQV